MEQQTITLKGKRSSLTAGATALAAMLAAAQLSFAGSDFNLGAGVQTVNPRVGHPDNVLPPGFSLRLLAHGEDPIENPSGVEAQPQLKFHRGFILM